MSYEYRSRTVWLEALHAEAHPANHDLCARHAQRLSAPNGWELVDRRGAAAGEVDHGAAQRAG